MVYVRIELWPGGDRTQARLLQEAIVINDGSGTVEEGNYQIIVGHSTTYKGDGFADPCAPAPSEVWRRGRLLGFRRRTASPASLVAQALSLVLRTTRQT
jgi:hypothetical protein